MLQNPSDDSGPVTFQLLVHFETSNAASPSHHSTYRTLIQAAFYKKPQGNFLNMTLSLSASFFFLFSFGGGGGGRSSPHYSVFIIVQFHLSGVSHQHSLYMLLIWRSVLNMF